MRKTIRAFLPFLSEVTHDFMLVACICGPLLIGMAFRFGVPFLEKQLCQMLCQNRILTPYYIIFDMVLAILTPILFCFSGVLVMLEEKDCRVTNYFFITPLGKKGYLTSRIVIPVLFAFFYDILLLWIFSISGTAVIMKIMLGFTGVLFSLITSLLVVTFSNNKMEGMALVKLCGLLLLGIPVVYFVEGPIKYLFCLMPSFWLAKLGMAQNISEQYAYFLLVVVNSMLLIGLLWHRYRKRL